MEQEIPPAQAPTTAQEEVPAPSPPTVNTSPPEPEPEFEDDIRLTPSGVGLAEMISGAIQQSTLQVRDVVAGSMSAVRVAIGRGGLHGRVPKTLEEAREILGQMPQIMKENSCATVVEVSRTESGRVVKEFRWRPLWRTSSRELGELGVGIELYFELLISTGVLFLVLFFISLPMLVMSLMGNYVADNPGTQELGWVTGRALALFTIANLGACTGTVCIENPEERLLCADGCSTRLRDVTFWIGLLDCLATVLFMLSGMLYLHWWIPKRAARHDAAHITAADFAIEVLDLPRVLGGARTSEAHLNYEKQLEEHFVNVLKWHNVIEDENPVHEVALMRDYGGYVRSFIDIGYYLKLKENEEAKAELCKNKKKAEGYMKKAEKLEETIQAMDDKMGEQGDMKDEEREVCGAVVMFKSERLKEIVLGEYEASSSFIGRLRQPPKLHFHGSKLRTKQACEPLDLNWDNLDYPHTFRMMRQAVMLLVTLLIFLVCLGLVLNLRSLTNTKRVVLEPVKTYVLSAVGPENSCIDVCNWAMFLDQRCEHPVQAPATRETSSGVAINPGLGNPASACASPSMFGDSSETCFPYIVYSTQEPVKADCMMAKVRTTSSLNDNAVSSAALYACRDWDASNPDLETQCRRLKHPFKGAADDTQQEALVEYDFSCEAPVSLVEAEAAKRWAADAGQEVGLDPTLACFCWQRQQEHGMLSRHSAWSKQEVSLCREHFDAKRNGYLAAVFTRATVCVLNVVFNLVFYHMDKWTRHRTMTGLAMSSMSKLFSVLFVNTGLLYLFVSADFHTQLPREILGPLSRFGQGPFSDVTGAWFVTSGANLFWIVSGSVIAFPLYPLAMSFIVSPLAIAIGRRGLVTEGALKEVYILPRWPLDLRLAQFVCVVFCVAMYSGGTPLLYLVGAVYCLVSYWSDKVCLLRGSQLPPTYHEDLVEHAVQWVLAASFLHVLMTSWMYGLQEVFPSSFVSWHGLFETIMTMPMATYEQRMADWRRDYEWNSYQNFPGYVHARLLDFGRGGCVVVALMTLSFVAYFLVYYVIWSSMVRPLRQMTAKHKDEIHTGEITVIQKALSRIRSGELTEERAKRLSVVTASGGKGHGLFSYKMGNNPKYADAYKALKYCETNDPIDMPQYCETNDLKDMPQLEESAFPEPVREEAEEESLGRALRSPVGRARGGRVIVSL